MSGSMIHMEAKSKFVNVAWVFIWADVFPVAVHLVDDCPEDSVSQ
jgi:hypothetical protein